MQGRTGKQQLLYQSNLFPNPKSLTVSTSFKIQHSFRSCRPKRPWQNLNQHSTKNAKHTSKLIASLMKEATNSSLKGGYDVCAELYGGAIDDLNKAGQILNKKVLSASDISTFRSEASAASDGPVTCEDALKDHQMSHQSLRKQIRKSDTRSARADLRGLAKISIDITRKDAEQTSNLIASLKKETTNSSLKGRYDDCAELYGDAIDDLNGAGQILNKKVLSPTRASAALDGPDTCEDSFEGPPAEPKQLRDANNKLEGLCSIILAIGARLESGGLN
ncbi:hypothetical protein C3L33_13033, partial [Rhododendron williamsianum]